jgi:16S rRNA processing protein RimM
VTRADPELLADRIPITIAGAVREVIRRGGTPERPVLRVRGVETREDAEALRGEPIMVSRADAPPLTEDEWWAEDLVGLRVVDGERQVGVVGRVLSYPSCEVLEVGELLVPLVGDAVRDVDLERGVVDVDLAFLDAS